MCDYNEYHINDDDDDLTEILKKLSKKEKFLL